jgi:hypothetical protein
MEGQSLLFISFTVHNFYFIQSEIIFLTDQTELLLHISFSIGGSLVPRSFSKIAPILDRPSPPPSSTVVSFTVFLHSCRNIVLGAAAFPSVLWTTCRMLWRFIWVVEQFWCLYPDASMQVQSNMFSVGATRRTCITATWGTKHGKSRDVCKYIGTMSSI